MRIAGSAVLFVLSLGCVALCSGTPTIGDDREQSIGSNQQAQDATLKSDLGTALASTGLAARIYFSGTCNVTRGQVMLLPDLRIKSPDKNWKGFKAVQDMFRDNPDVVVSEGRPGIVTIWIGDVSKSVLNTRISELSLSQLGQYNPGGLASAIEAIERTSEFKAAAEKSKLRKLPVFHDNLLLPADEKLPHLAASIKNTTIDQALDMVAKTFNGVVTYGECRQPDGTGFIDIEFKQFPGK